MYGATSLGSNEQLVWKFLNRGALPRLSKNPIHVGFACRIQQESESTTIDHYEIMALPGSDYLFLHPTSGTVISRSDNSLTATESEPQDEQIILSKAALAPGDFWYEENSEPSEIGLICVDRGIVGVIQHLHHDLCRK